MCSESHKFSLTSNIEKNEINKNKNDNNFMLHGKEIEQYIDLSYLGSVIFAENSVEKGILTRINNINAHLLQIWNSLQIHLKKMRLLKSNAI